jgi:hypothetical protein
MKNVIEAAIDIVKGDLEREDSYSAFGKGYPY